MYRMLIVDDEKLIVDGLYELLLEYEGDRLNLLKASSAREALEVLADRKVDILMTDIRMPKMSGLELGDVVRKSWPDCRLIYLSGYDDFDFIHHAVKSGAQSYLLKSEGDERILETVRQTISELDKRTEIQSLLKQANDLRRQHIAHHRSLYLSDLLMGLLPEEELTEIVSETLGLAIDVSKPIRLASIRLDADSSTIRMRDKDILFAAVLSVCGQYLAPLVRFESVVMNREVIVLLYQPIDEMYVSEERLLAFIEGVFETTSATALKSTGHTFSFAIGDKASSLRDAAVQYAKLNMLFTQVYGEKQIIIRERNFPHTISTPMQSDAGAKVEVYLKKVSLLDMYLETGRIQEVMQVLQEFRILIAQAHAEERYQELYYATAIRYLTVVNKYGLNRVAMIQEQMNRLMEPSGFNTRDEAIHAMERLAILLGDYYSSNSLKMREDVVEKLKAFIESHLSEDLSLTRLAEVVHFNPDYMSKLFKQSEQCTITEYISMLKIRQAKVWLADPDILVQQIAKDLNFTTASYFSRYFKKETGMTPQEFRANRPSEK
ncbi:response regulator [Cohnella sp. GbtcB17]|uniref:response regulator transcription factor n=1 Tax=Cohnella sp. GbtcB17 TaxID=2824762 RepID=UPI001C30BB68|nr:response regulator [Cohnella sp. GbtcB17]